MLFSEISKKNGKKIEVKTKFQNISKFLHFSRIAEIVDKKIGKSKLTIIRLGDLEKPSENLEFIYYSFEPSEVDEFFYVCEVSGNI